MKSMASKPFSHLFRADCFALKEKVQLLPGVSMGWLYAFATVLFQCTSPILLNPSPQGSLANPSFSCYFFYRLSSTFEYFPD